MDPDRFLGTLPVSRDDDYAIDIVNDDDDDGDEEALKDFSEFPINSRSSRYGYRSKVSRPLNDSFISGQHQQQQQHDFWQARPDQQVDQSVNLMDAETSTYTYEDKRPSTKARTMVDIFLSDDHHRNSSTNYPRTSAGSGNKYGVADLSRLDGSGKWKNRACRLLVLVAVSLVLLAIVLALPQFGGNKVPAFSSSTSGDNNGNTPKNKHTVKDSNVVLDDVPDGTDVIEEEIQVSRPGHR